jgi:hypothetical protein
MLYALFGARPVIAMLVNAIAGTVIVWSVHRVAGHFAGPKAAVLAALVALCHPTLLFYVPAVMTELVSAALLIGATALAVGRAATPSRFWLRLLCVGGLLGLATLVRPQQLLFAPVLGALAARDAWPRLDVAGRSWIARALVSAALVSGLAVGTCLPWTWRNCQRMDRCVFVSANAGWNLLIGASSRGNGAWASVDAVGVPEACRLVFAEAAKDACFGHAALGQIVQHPIAWLRLVPAKLERTFDDVGAPGWYLNNSDWHHFDDRAKFALGVAEALSQRLLMLAVLVGLARVPGKGARRRRLLALAAAICQFYTVAWLGVLLACLGVLSLGRRTLQEPLLTLFAIAYGSTAVVHSVFFGGARYTIVVIPYMVVAVARAWWSPGQSASLIEVAH